MSARARSAVAITALAWAAAGCFAPGVNVSIWDYDYEVKTLRTTSSSGDATLRNWDDQGAIAIELNYVFKAGKERLLSGITLRRFEGVLTVNAEGITHTGRTDGQQFDWNIVKLEHATRTSHADAYFGLYWGDSPTYVPPNVQTDLTFDLVIGGGATRLFPIAKTDLALGVGIEGRLDYIASGTAGWHAELALNAREGSRLMTRSKRSTYLAVGYRQTWMGQFLTTRVLSSSDYEETYHLGTECSGIYVKTSIYW